MKIKLLAMCLMLSSLAYGQNISESIYNYKGSFNSIFSKEKSVLNIDLVKNYTIGSMDTSHLLVLDLQKNTVEITGMSLGNTAFGTSISFVDKEIRDQSILDKASFLEFYECIKKVHSHISKYDYYNKNPNNMVATCGGNNILMGGEYTDRSLGSRLKYYFKLGNNEAYSMTSEQFIEVVQTLSKIKDYWTKN